MLEDLSGRDFEVWAKVLLERHLGHEVEDQPYVADEGREGSRPVAPVRVTISPSEPATAREPSPASRPG